MRRGQPAVLFSFTVLVALVRALAYGGTPVGQALSPAALAEFVVLHVLAFALAAFLVATMSRATVSRAAQVAVYAQGLLFLAPFVDVALGLPIASYEDTYVAGIGTPGAIVADLAFAAVVAWGVWEASVGTRRARQVNAGVAAILAVASLSLLAVPWPRPLLTTGVAWGLSLGLAVYYGALACLVLALAVRAGNRAIHARFWGRPDRWALPVFAVLPPAGLLAVGVFFVPASPSDALLRLRLDAPYMGAVAAVGVLLATQHRLVTEATWGRRRLEVAALVKIVALCAAFLLGWGAFLATGAAASLVWLQRDRASLPVLGAIAALAVLVGNLTVEAVDFADIVSGPITFTLAVGQWALPTALGLFAAVVAGVVVPPIAWFTSRTSA